MYLLENLKPMLGRDQQHFATCFNLLIKAAWLQI